MSFSDIALKNMLARQSNTINKVGRELKKAEPIKYQNFEATDCITFVLNVLKETFEEVGQKKIADSLISYGMSIRSGGNKKFYGDLLAKELVVKHRWKGIYLTPDRHHPTDADSEHTFATTMALRHCNYANVPLSYTVIDYNPTAASHSNFQALNKFNQRKLNALDLKAISAVKFGFGISRGGMHTWLFSKGRVFEVHWDQVGSKLYENRALKDFPWLSSLMVVPPDANSALAISASQCK